MLLSLEGPTQNHKIYFGGLRWSVHIRLAARTITQGAFNSIVVT